MNYEAQFLSALLKNQDMISVMSGSSLKDIIVSHKDIWEFIYKYYQDNKQTPPVSVVHERFPDFQYNGELEGSSKHYKEVLVKAKTRTDLEYMITQALKALHSNEHDPTLILNHFMKRTTEISRETGSAVAVDLRDVNHAVDHYSKVRALSDAHGGQPGIMSGFESFDKDYPTGFAAGHFVVLMGYSGLGKTWFGIKLMINAWLQGYSPMIINLEMSPEELRDRIYFLISEYTMDDLVKAKIDPENFKTWAADFMEGRSEFHLVGSEGFGDFTTDMVQAKIEQYKPDIVLCDYLQLFSDRSRSNSEIEKAKRTAREFKQLATAARIPIIVVTAVTGKDKKDRVNPPEIAQVAWSSEIEYAANLGFAVHTNRDANQMPKDTDIVFRKNRHGALTAFKVKMDLDKGTIKEIPPEDLMQWIDPDGDDDPLKFLEDK